MRDVAAILAISLATGSAVAQERITPEAFLDLAAGKTLTFNLFPSGEPVGTEEFLSRTLSVWREVERGCVYGRVSIDAGQVCFLYDDDRDGVPICWTPFFDGNRYFVGTGAPGSIEVQEVTSITEDSLKCPIKPGV